MAEEASSLVGVVETTVELKCSAEMFNDLLVGRPHHISHASPSKIQEFELQEGEIGQVGSVISWNLVHDGEVKEVKSTIVAIDPEKNKATYKLLDGHLTTEYKSFIITFQVTPKDGESGSIAHWHIEYEKMNDEVSPESLLELAVKVSKEMDEYLLS